MCFKNRNYSLHDLGNFAKYIDSDVARDYHVEECRGLKMSGDLSTMTLDDLAEWLSKNQEVILCQKIKDYL